jgi:hypothetical protein
VRGRKEWKFREKARREFQFLGRRGKKSRS